MCEPHSHLATKGMFESQMIWHAQKANHYQTAATRPTSALRLSSTAYGFSAVAPAFFPLNPTQLWDVSFNPPENFDSKASAPSSADVPNTGGEEGPHHLDSAALQAKVFEGGDTAQTVAECPYLCNGKLQGRHRGNEGRKYG